MIVVAVQRGTMVYVYGERNQLLFCMGGELTGYTATSVSIKKGNAIYTYSDENQLISTHMC